ncbi:MAG: N-acetylmuramoyl-L-alanine amidase [Alphaproteobacteria bacterium]|nr:N-acetylmuramoyl-L-alanine amidase [Alphaproteobacteria bacterium]
MMKIIRKFLPYFDERPTGIKVKALVLHCSAHSAMEMINVLQERELSSHYVIDIDGTAFQLVSEKCRAWHAGQSKWRNMNMLNQYSIGIELSSSTLGQKEYTPKQIKSLITLSRQIIKHYQIPATNVVAHSDIAPTRKPDPGLAFPWQKLAQKGIGTWYDLNNADKITENDVRTLLKIVGYDVADLSAASYAFCRHFVPEAVNIDNDVYHLVDNVYPKDFILPEKYLPILKAVAYQYQKSSEINLISEE